MHIFLDYNAILRKNIWYWSSGATYS